MPDTQDPDDLLRALAKAGLYQPQIQQLQRQYGLGEQLFSTPGAQGRQVGQTYVAASPLEHLSNAIRQYVGAGKMKKAVSDEQDLTNQLGANRQRYMQEMQTAQSGGQGAPEMLARPPDPQRAQALMMAGAGSGDPAIQNMAHFGQQAQHYQNELARLTNTANYQTGMLGIRKEGVEQKDRELWNGTDMFGNPISRPKHAPAGATSVLPRSTANGPPSTTPNAGPADPAQTYPFGRSGPTQAAIDKYAEQLATTGQMPAGKWGKASAAVTSAISNRMTALYPDVNLATNRAGYVADMSSLRKMQGQSDAMESFETTALKNLDTFLQAAHSVVDTGSPLFNLPARKFMEAVAGDPKMAAFNTSRQVAVQEISKVLGGSLGGTAVSDSARHEASGLLGPDSSIAQIDRAAQIIKTDMANRKGAVADQINTIRGRLQIHKGGQPAAAAGTPTPAAPPAASSTVRVKYKGQLLDIPAGRLPEAIKDGAEQVK